MRKLLVLIIAVLAVMGGSIETDTAQAKKPTCVGVHQGINFYRGKTWHWQDKLGVARTKASKKPIRSCAYAKWVANLWRDRAHDSRKKWNSHVRYLNSLNSSPIAAIRYVFGPYGQAEEAVTVARCETGGTFSVYAKNGQFLGLFQMGNWARSVYGHGWTALEQARAALRYWLDSGWSGWQCLPYGGLRW